MVVGDLQQPDSVQMITLFMIEDFALAGQNLLGELHPWLTT